MSKNKEYEKRVIESIESEISVLEDGFYFWFPSGNGAVDASSLRIIADHLDDLNKEHKQKIDDYFDSLNKEQEFGYPQKDE